MLPGLEAAVKLLHPHMADLEPIRQQMRDRAGVLARLRHPRIVRVLDFIEDGPLCALVVEPVEGKTLAESLEEGTDFPMRRILSVLKDVLGALGHAHGLGLVHGELTPADLLFTPDGQVKLLDFGTGALADGGVKDPRAARIDLVAVGHIVHGMLTGRPPGTRPPTEAKLVQAGAPKAFAEIVLRLMQVHPTKSFGSCGEALGALENATGQKVSRTVGKTLHFPGCIVDLARQQVMRPGKTEKLSSTERELLVHFAMHAGRVQSRDVLLREVWGIRGNVITRAVDVAVRRLRAKVEVDPADPQHILTVHGEGYRFEAPEDGLFETATGSLRKLSEIRMREALSKESIPSEGPSFHGREEDMAALKRHFASGARLVVLTGPGGMGKTRAAMEFAEAHLQAPLDDATPFFCDLQTVQDKESLLVAVASALGLSMAEMGSGEDVEAIGACLRSQGSTLLILDNFEQVVEVAKDSVAAWMKAAPEARFLVTSQTLLGLGERVHELQPLGDRAAVELFIERAKALKYDFEPDAAEREDILALTKALDGIPLGIELAASRIRMLSPAQLRARMSERLDLLAQDGEVDRTATLRGAISWSWKLLSDAERDLITQAAVFSGGFSAASAEAVLDAGEQSVLSLLQSLVDKSLLRSLSVPGLSGERRFHFFESIRLFCADKLREEEGLEALRLRHRDHFVALGEELAAGIDSVRGAEKMRRLALELDNLLQIQRDWVERDPVLSVRAALVAEPTLAAQGPAGVYGRVMAEAAALSESGSPALQVAALEACIRWRTSRELEREQVEADLLRAERAAGDNPLLKARVAVARVWAVNLPGARIQESLPLLKDALATFEKEQDVAGQVDALRNLLRCHELLGNAEEAEAYARRALELTSKGGLKRSEADIQRALGVLLCNSGRLEDAESNLLDALELFDSFQDQRKVGVCQVIMSDICLGLGRHDECMHRLEDARRIALSLGNDATAALALGSMGRVALDRGDVPRARNLLRDAASGLGSLIPALGFTRLHLGLAWLLDGQAEEGERIIGQAMDLLVPERFQVGRCYGLAGHALALHQLGQGEKATQVIQEALDLVEDQERPAQLTVALVRSRMGQGERPDPGELARLRSRSAELRLFAKLTRA
jgi:predicted ATPase/DNA-binding winged helix-turn-helix (wHTH) protein